MLEHFNIRHDGNIEGGLTTTERKGMLGGAIRTALMFGLGIAGLYTQDAHSTPPVSYCNDSGCVVYPEGNYLLGNDYSFWDWTGWHDDYPMNDWEGVTQGDVSFGGIYNSPVCNAILADGPQNCTADDMNRASGSNISMNQLGLGANSGLGMLVRSSGNTAVVGAAIDQYISTVGGIQARQNAGIIIRLGV